MHDEFREVGSVFVPSVLEEPHLFSMSDRTLVSRARPLEAPVRERLELGERAEIARERRSAETAPIATPVASSVDGTGLGMLLSVVIQSKRGRCEKISGRTKSRVDLHLEKEHNRTRYEELVDIFDHVILYMTKCGFRSFTFSRTFQKLILATN
jgi:hypothetical protein